MEDEPTLMDMFKGLARRWRLNMSTLRRGISTLLVSVLVMCLTLATPGHVCAALSSSLTGTINVASGNVTIQGKTDAGALVVINGRQFRASAAGTFSASFPLAGTATIAVVSTSRPGFSMLLSLPAIPSVARHVLPVMTFSYDGTSRTLGLAGKLTHGSPRMTVGGVAKAIDAQGTKPLISNGTTMVPIRAIVESLGGSVGWDTAARRCDIRLGSRTVTT